MTVQPVSILLRKLNKESLHYVTETESLHIGSITGYQMLYNEAVQHFSALTDRIDELKSRLHILYDLATERRQKLQHWRVKPNCSRNKQACRNGSCGCSYEDLVMLRGILEAQRTQFNEVATLQNEAFAYRVAAKDEITRRFIQLCKQPATVLHFVEVMYMCGDISSSEWNFISMFDDTILLHGTPYELYLTIETCNQSLTICWDQFSERINPP